MFISKKYGIKTLGEYSYVLAILTPLTILGSLQLKSYLLTAKSDIKSQAKWLRLIFPMTLIILSSLILVWFQPVFITIYLALAFIKWGEIWSDLANGLTQLETGLSKVNKSIFIRYLSLSITLFFIWMLNFELTLTLIILAIVSCIIAIQDYYQSGLDMIRAERIGSYKTFKTTLSLSLSALLTALLVNIPRYILKEYYSIETVGLFSVLFYYYVIPSMVINFSCQGLIQNMATISSHRLFLLITTLTIGVLAFSYFLVLHFFGEQITGLLYNSRMVLSSKISLLIAISFFLGGVSSAMHYTLLGKNIYGIQLKTNILSSLLCLVSGFYLIAKFEIIGAFISFILGLLVQLTMYINTYLKFKNE
ncbi:MAG: lipopolysaccharide biosynthesis protein [Bacteriovoracaceae bacterium]